MTQIIDRTSNACDAEGSENRAVFSHTSRIQSDFLHYQTITLCSLSKRRAARILGIYLDNAARCCHLQNFCRLDFHAFLQIEARLAARYISWKKRQASKIISFCQLSYKNFDEF